MNKYKSKTYCELYQEDIKNIKKVLNNNIDALHYDEEYGGWFFLDEPLVDYLHYDEDTFLNPKELIGTLEEYIEKTLQIKR